MTWKNNTVLIWQGVSISNALKGDIYHLTRVGIQIATLSRSTHTAVLKKYKDKYYLLQANMIKGIHIVEVYKPWLNNQLDSGKILYFETNPRKKFKKYDVLIQVMYETGRKEVNMARYNTKGVINQFFLNVFGKSPLQKQSPRKYDAMFCSELTMWYLNKDSQAYKYSPYDVLQYLKLDEYKSKTK